MKLLHKSSLAGRGMTVVLAFVLLAPVSLAESGTQEVSTDVDYSLEITAPAAYDWGALAVGTHESGLQEVVVKSTGAFDLNINADAGNMREYSLALADYVLEGQSLEEPMQWKEAAQGSYSVISTADAAVVQDQPPTGDSGTTISVKYRQQVGYNDTVLDAGKTYRMLITYTAVSGL
jgi:hypothetical protein